MELGYRRYSLGDLEAKFQFDDDNTMQYYQDGESISVYKVKVKKNGFLAEKYFIEIDDVNFDKLNKVVQEFLENPEYRKTLTKSNEGVTGEVLGEWVIPYLEESGVNKYCKRQIDHMNSIQNENIRFKEFVNLKTYGRDKYSLLNLDDLIKLSKPKNINTIKEALSDEKEFAAALRWFLRGLKADYAIRKVNVDKEITEKNKDRYRGK